MEKKKKKKKNIRKATDGWAGKHARVICRLDWKKLRQQKQTRQTDKLTERRATGRRIIMQVDP